MAKLNQAQEPSMEEILASIRRIISDDGDDAEPDGHRAGLQTEISTAAIDALFGQRPGAAAQPLPGDDPLPSFLRSEAKAPARGGANTAANGAARAAETQVPHALRSAESRAAEPRPFAETRQAEARAPEQRPAEPRHVEARHVEPRAAEPRPAEPRVADIRQKDTHSAEPARSRAEPQSRPQSVAPDHHPREAAPRAAEWAGAEPAGSPRPASRDETGAAEIARRAVAAAVDAPQPARLLSPAADAAVSAAFGDLAQTRTAGPSPTLEDLVRDMLRPMLKAWLDANLPPLVERLVREEIERVSRGR